MTSTMSHCWVRTLCAWVCNKCAKYHHISKVLYLDVKYLAIFLPVWTRVKNSRDSNRAFLVCGNAPHVPPLGLYRVKTGYGQFYLCHVYGAHTIDLMH